jgi:hypothetical protein
MRLKHSLGTLLALSSIACLNLNAADLFQTKSSAMVSKSIAGASQNEVDNLRMVNTSIRDAHIYDLNSKSLGLSTSELTLNLTPYLSVDFKKKSVKTSVSGSIVWEGQPNTSSHKNNTNSLTTTNNDSAILVLRNGKVTGTARIDGKLFKIQPLKSGQHLVLEIDENNMKPDHPQGTMQALEAELSNHPLITSNKLAIDSLNAVPVIKLLVVYSNEVPAEVNDVPALVDLAIAETNQGYANSNINASVELAHLEALNYDDTNISTDLGRLQSTSDGHMDEVHALRDEYAADIVMLLVSDNGSACGQAAGIGATESTAFAVTAQDCATGYYSFGHEIGHLQSARHNPETDPTTTPYAFGHGYRDPNNAWRTVMAYNCAGGCTRINWWSNPNNTRNGTPMGTHDDSDNARVLNTTAATIAAFRNDPVPDPTPQPVTSLWTSTQPGDWGIPFGVTFHWSNSSAGAPDHFSVYKRIYPVFGKTRYESPYSINGSLTSKYISTNTLNRNDRVKFYISSCNSENVCSATRTVEYVVGSTGSGGSDW